MRKWAIRWEWPWHTQVREAHTISLPLPLFHTLSVFSATRLPNAWINIRLQLGSTEPTLRRACVRSCDNNNRETCWLNEWKCLWNDLMYPINLHVSLSSLTWCRFSTRKSLNHLIRRPCPPHSTGTLSSVVSYPFRYMGCHAWLQSLIKSKFRNRNVAAPKFIDGLGYS